ncbi:hypothetical protein Si026_01860 [Streptococcus infantarius subsp. infantarius]|nr:hypothetical protein [Streptococcus infantarius subsp. infantarius]
MKIEIYNTKQTFKLVESYELSSNEFESFKELIFRLAWGDYAKSGLHTAYAIDKEKNIDCKLDAVMLSGVVDDEDERGLFDMLLKAESNQSIQEFSTYYLELER